MGKRSVAITLTDRQREILEGFTRTSWQSTPSDAACVSLCRLICDFKCWTIFWPSLAMVVNPRGRNIGVPEPFLHLRDVRSMVERIGGRRSP